MGAASPVGKKLVCEKSPGSSSEWLWKGGGGGEQREREARTEETGAGQTCRAVKGSGGQLASG